MKIEEVVEKHSARILCLARKMLHNETDAEDVLQNVVVLILRKIENFRGECDIGSWIHRIAVNECLSMIKKRKRKSNYVDLDKIDESRQADPSEKMSHLERLRSEESSGKIMKCIESIGINKRVVLMLHLDGCDNTQISNILEIDLSAVKSRLHRAKIEARNIIKREEVLA